MRLLSLPLLCAALPLPWELCAQTTPGAELWRLAAVTLPAPPALATGATGAFWNPAQADSGRGRIGIEVIRTPDVIGAAGVMAAVRIPLPRIGSLGIVYGRMGVSDLVHTIDSPDPDGAAIPFYNQDLALGWSHSIQGLTLGASVSYRDTRLDRASISEWGVDLGLVQRFGDRLRIAAATRGLRRLSNDPAQDVYAGAEYRLWRGSLWRGASGLLRARYGISGGHPGGVDHQFGAGLEIGAALALDAELEREGSYGHAAWRGAAGLQVAVGRYRLSFARDGGISDLGSTFRVGLEVRIT